MNDTVNVMTEKDVEQAEEAVKLQAQDRADRDNTIKILEGMIENLKGLEEEQSPLVAVFAKRGTPETKEDGTIRVNYETHAVAVFKGVREAEHLAETLNGIIDSIKRRCLKELVEKLLGI